ncbi:unnamed protein product [Rotaria sordida]|uniref:C2H2-type domain-containing protein n=1 Tax=Rotaria sordida TaxID=392033 RepID=A0A819B1S2_9BILA|nr:unnamed protein product [Rotaria sordida]CAF3791132.1 unnamed protein product [Rotaria sordida]CAF3824076.1 unnamed protein product [Rotaria sordida]
MSGLFNRLKSRKSVSHHTNNNENESTTSAPAFDEEGFLCPICHHKFNDHISLEQHYTQIHAQGLIVNNENTNNMKNILEQEERQIKKIIINKI